MINLKRLCDSLKPYSSLTVVRIASWITGLNPAIHTERP
ncbi:MAG: hypothetical protein ACI9TH_003073, partial [Kiritimatiellia bacterium]